MAYLWVAIGGALGSVGRFWVDGLISEKFGAGFPWGTLFINIGGSFVIGIVGALTTAEGRLDSQARVFAIQFLMIGVCGGYTTFSSFSWRTLRFIQERQWFYAGGYVMLSFFLCLIAVWLGYLLGAILNSTKGS